MLDEAGENSGRFSLDFYQDAVTKLINPVVLSPDRTVVMSGFLNLNLEWEWEGKETHKIPGEYLFHSPRQRALMETKWRQINE